MRSAPLLSAVLLAAVVSPALAQIEQRSIRLNDPVLANQYLSVTDKTGLQNLTGLTIEAWVYPTSYAGFPTIVGNGYTSSFWLGLSTAGALRFYPNTSGAFYEFGTIPLNEWSHVAATYNATTGAVNLYKNGFAIAVTTGWSGNTGTFAGDLRIGADRELGAPAYFFRGYLDEVRVWNVARTPSQIYETHHVSAGGPSFRHSIYDGLIACWTMQSSSGTTIPDLQVGEGEIANDAAMVNGPALTDNGAPLAHDSAIAFDGDYVVLPIASGFSAGVTLSAWIAPDPPAAFANEQAIVARNRHSSWWLGLDASGHVLFRPIGGMDVFVTSAATIPAESWTHVAGTYRNGVTRIYVNGALDTYSTAITGPIGEASFEPYVGAEPFSEIPGFYYYGLIDHVRIIRGALAAPAIRDGMFRIPEDAPGQVRDEDGVLRAQYVFNAENLPLHLWGGQARLVRSLMPVFATTTAGYGAGLGGWHYSMVGDLQWFGSTRTSSIEVTENVPITDVDVFVTGGFSELRRGLVTLRSPDGTTVRLKLSGEGGAGIGLHAIFNDESAITLASGVPPYVDGVRPHDPLSVLDGELSAGPWTLSMIPDEFQTTGLGAWGLRLNGNNSASVGDAPADRVALAHDRANPAHGSGTLRFTLPRAGHVRLTLHDVHGRLVRTLDDAARTAGVHRVRWNAAALPSGLYFVRLAVDGRLDATLKTVIAR